MLGLVDISKNNAKSKQGNRDIEGQREVSRNNEVDG